MKTLYLSTAYLDDLMVRMAHHSTAIEGNSLTQGETKSVLIDGYVPRAIDLRELNEVLNYKAFTKEMVRFLQEEREVNGEFIKEIHSILCREAIESVPGKFKRSLIWLLVQILHHLRRTVYRWTLNNGGRIWIISLKMLLMPELW